MPIRFAYIELQQELLFRTTLLHKQMSGVGMSFYSKHSTIIVFFLFLQERAPLLNWFYIDFRKIKTWRRNMKLLDDKRMMNE